MKGKPFHPSLLYHIFINEFLQNVQFYVVFKCNKIVLTILYNLLYLLFYFVYRMCILGKRLLKDIHIQDCNKTVGGPLHNIFCTGNGTDSCDPYYVAHNVSIVNGIKGLASGVFLCKFLFSVYNLSFF